MVIISTGIALTLAGGLLTLLFLARGDLPYAIGAGVAALTTLLVHILDYYYAIAIISTGIVLVSALEYYLELYTNCLKGLLHNCVIFTQPKITT